MTNCRRLEGLLNRFTIMPSSILNSSVLVCEAYNVLWRLLLRCSPCEVLAVWRVGAATKVAFWAHESWKRLVDWSSIEEPDALGGTVCKPNVLACFNRQSLPVFLLFIGVTYKPTVWEQP